MKKIKRAIKPINKRILKLDKHMGAVFGGLIGFVSTLVS